MSGWQPIDTAPRDGTRVRLAHHSDVSSMKEKSISQIFGSWNGRSWDLSAFFRVPGGRYGLMSNSPTHWMPLQEASTAEGGAA